MNIIPDKIKEIDADKIDEKLDAGVVKVTSFMDKYSPFHLIGKLVTWLPWWATLLLIFALIVGAWWGISSFADWVAERRVGAERVRWVEEIRLEREKVADAIKKYDTLKSEYDATKIEVAETRAALETQTLRVSQQQKRTAAVLNTYEEALTAPQPTVKLAQTNIDIERQVDKETQRTREAILGAK